MEQSRKNPTVFRYSPPTSCHAACGTLSPSVSVVQQQRFTEQRVCVGLHVASELLKINLRCVARGCLGDASEREEKEVSELHEGAKIQLTLVTALLSDGLMFVHSLPPTTLSLCALQLLLACCTKTSKLLNIQVLTCQISSLTGFIRHFSKPTAYAPFTELL